MEKFIGANPVSMENSHPRQQVERQLRAPRPEDAAAIWELAQRDPALDTNSPYAYLLLCSDFASTGAIAEVDGQIAGFVLGYRPPARPEAWFVWQIGVDLARRGLGLGSALLAFGLEQLASEGVSFLEATVTPSNAASDALFRNLARRAGARLATATAFGAELFPSGDHEAEVRVRIGPIDPDSPHKENS